MYSKDVYDKLMNEVLKSNEYAMKKLLKYLKDKSLEEIVIEIDDMDGDDLESLNKWALKAETYEVCQAIQNILSSK